MEGRAWNNQISVKCRIVGAVLLLMGILAACAGEPEKPLDRETKPKKQTTSLDRETESEKQAESLDKETEPEKPLDMKTEPEKLAEPLHIEEMQEKSDMMDFLYYAQESLRLEEEDIVDGKSVRSFKGNREAYAAIQAYTELLCKEYAFTAVGEPHYREIKEYVFFDFVLSYEGDRAGVGDNCEGTFSKQKGALMIYGTIERDRMEGAIWYEAGLKSEDDGYRYGQEVPALSYRAESTEAALYRMPDGSFQTEDGRLSAKLGQANVLIDGESYTYDAVYEIDSTAQQLKVQVQSPTATCICFYVPNTYQWEQGMFPTERFIVDSNWAVSDRGVSEGLPQYSWQYMFTAVHNDSYVYPVRGFGGEMRGLSLRTMYLDEDAGVFYVAASFETEPVAMEALIVVDMDVEPTEHEETASGSSDGDCSFCHGSGRCSNCGGSGKVKKLFAGTRERVEQDCTSCRPSGSGKCSFCGGSGDK